MKLYFIRHGESEHNQALSERGLVSSIPEKRDLPLTDEGIAQIEKILTKLPDTIDVFYCSDHIRTRQSADILQKKYPATPYTIDARINASFGGEFDHKSFDEIKKITGIDFQRAVNDDTFDYRPWGGECAADVHARVKDFLHDMIVKHEHETIIVVGSVESIKSAYHNLFQKYAPNLVRALRIKNGTIHEFNITKDMI